MATAEASHNALFRQIVAAFAPLMAVAAPAAWSTRVVESQQKLMIDRHLAVAHAIAAKDPATAVSAMDSHFDASVGDVLRALTEQKSAREH